MRTEYCGYYIVEGVGCYFVEDENDLSLWSDPFDTFSEACEAIDEWCQVDV